MNPENSNTEQTCVPAVWKLTPREELAVINQRLKAHLEDCNDERAKALLEIAADCVRSAIHRR